MPSSYPPHPHFLITALSVENSSQGLKSSGRKRLSVYVGGFEDVIYG